MTKRYVGLPLIIVAVLLAASGFFPALGSAQGGSAEPYTVAAGPYRLAIVTDPSSLSLGSVRLKITVLSSEHAGPVPDAKVVIRSRHQTDGTVGWANALNTPSAPESYQARIELEGPGTWLLSIDVASSLGRVEVEIPSVTVPEPRRTTSGGLVFVGVLVVLLSGAGYVTWTIRRSQRQRQAADES